MQLKCILLIPKPWFIFLCLRPFALAITFTWIALSQNTHMILSLTSFKSSLTCLSWKKIASHHSALLHHFMILHSSHYHEHTLLVYSVYFLP